MKTGKLISIIIFVFLAAALFCSCGNQTQNKTELKFGTGGSGGTYYSYATQFSDLTKNDFSFEIKTTAGSAANIRLLQKGFLDLAIIQSDYLYSAETGTDMFSDDKKIGDARTYSAVCGLYTEALQLVANADTEILSPEDLSGKSVSVGEEESGIVENARQVLNQYGITFDDLDVHYMSFSESADAMRNGTIDAFFCIAGAPTAAVSDLSGDMDIRILSLGEKEMKHMINLNDCYMSCTIPAGTYNGQTEDIHTLGVRAILVASNDLDAATVNHLISDLFRYSETLNAAVVTDGAIDPESAILSVPIPFHKGAVEFMKEKGVYLEDYQGVFTSGVFASQDN